MFPDDLRDRLRADLEAELAGPVSALPDGETLFVSKHALATVHGCEARWHSDEVTSDFTPSVAVVQGSVAHKAIELTLNRRSPSTPAELVDTAIDRLAGADRWMSDWLRDCDEDDRAEVRGAAVARVTSFAEVWPPLKPSWRPVTEQSLRAEVAGRADRALGAGRPGPGQGGRHAGREGGGRLQDRPVRRAPPRRPALLRPGRGPAHRGAAPGRGHLLPGLRPAPRRGRHRGDAGGLARPGSPTGWAAWSASSTAATRRPAARRAPAAGAASSRPAPSARPSSTTATPDRALARCCPPCALARRSVARRPAPA